MVGNILRRHIYVTDMCQSDLHTVDSENAHKRRRLITGKEHGWRASLVEPESTSDEDNTTKNRHGGRTKHALKRSRDSLSPDRPPSGESDSIRLNVKKRRTVDSNPEESRATLAKTSNPSSEKSTPKRSRQDECKLAKESRMKGWGGISGGSWVRDE
jgi:hypothetical protein